MVLAEILRYEDLVALLNKVNKLSLFELNSLEHSSEKHHPVNALELGAHL